MQNMDHGEKRDLVLSPGEFAYLQDLTRGQVKTHVGPIVVNQTAQDAPIVFDGQKFRRTNNLEGSVRQSPIASEGDYIILTNPAQDDSNPKEASVANTPELNNGRKVNIPGPCTFPLWPGQNARVVQGHTLRSNQYLVVRIYNETEATQNWNDAVVKKNNSGDGEDAVASADAEKLNLVIGRRFIIKGTEVSFYIPPTGVEVLQDENGNYVRDAITLERLEYAILVDEDGNKRYEKGPQVVFPEPTEEFFIDGRSRKFKAIELNHIQGIHIKVIAPYKENEKEYKEGDELFITGEDCAIYYPRPEHNIIQYGDKQKHYAVAVPEGEGRYVMDRKTGKIDTATGPVMLLPNPVDEVIVRRVLSEKECKLWYPDNYEALEYNNQLRGLAESEQDHVPEEDLMTYASARGAMASMSKSKSYEEKIPGGFKRGTKFTKPREITLDTKFEGVPVIAPWTGYAVMVVSKTGDRRVVVGPNNVLLGYGESLEVLSLSTGKPKNTDYLERTVYLRIKNNNVADIVRVVTSDHVELDLKLSLKVNFVGEDPNKWFEVENYVKFLTDHIRSMLKGALRKFKIEDFYENGVDIIRDIILGESEDGKRPGCTFEENNMQVGDVEVLDIQIVDREVSNLLENAQFGAVADNIKLKQSERQLAVANRNDEIERERIESRAKTVDLNLQLEKERIEKQLVVTLTSYKSELDEEEKRKEVTAAKEEIADMKAEAELTRYKASKAAELETSAAKLEMELKRVAEETKARVEELGAVEAGFSEALIALSNQDTLQKVAQALSVQQILGGENVVDAITKVFEGTGLDSRLIDVVSKVTKSE